MTVMTKKGDDDGDEEEEEEDAVTCVWMAALFFFPFCLSKDEVRNIGSRVLTWERDEWLCFVFFSFLSTCEHIRDRPKTKFSDLKIRME